MHIRFIRALLFGLVVLSMSAASFAQIGVAIRIGPPALPVYEQPLCPGDGYLWTPGYWAYDYDVNDYYWVPGTWVMAPEIGFLWTPAYWGWGGDGFVFYDGYWGPHVIEGRAATIQAKHFAIEPGCHTLFNQLRIIGTV